MLNFLSISLFQQSADIMAAGMSKYLFHCTVQHRGLKLKLCVGQTNTFEITGGGLHVIFSNISLSILFKIKHNIMTTPLHIIINLKLYCTVFSLLMYVVYFYPVQQTLHKIVIEKLLDFKLQTLLDY
jgi:hypothetical protein